jgi:hypothetical protein
VEAVLFVEQLADDGGARTGRGTDGAVRGRVGAGRVGAGRVGAGRGGAGWGSGLRVGTLSSFARFACKTPYRLGATD